jgi:hypothetical protein
LGPCGLHIVTAYDETESGCRVGDSQCIGGVGLQ